MKPLSEENYSLEDLIRTGKTVYVRFGFDPLYDLYDKEAVVNIKRLLTNRPGVVVGHMNEEKGLQLEVRFPWLRESLTFLGEKRTEEDIAAGDCDWYIWEKDLSFTPWNPLNEDQKSNINQALERLKSIEL